MLLATIIRRFGLPILGAAVLVVGVVLFLVPPTPVGGLPANFRAVILVIIGLGALVAWVILARRGRH
ncbi:MAG: hypothetical protein JWQ43_142 [Glaciihabitans sp.]|nr:hypothetical protein [Glaciihabitans sp.]